MAQPLEKRDVRIEVAARRRVGLADTDRAGRLDDWNSLRPASQREVEIRVGVLERPIDPPDECRGTAGHEQAVAVCRIEGTRPRRLLPDRVEAEPPETAHH